MYVCVQSYWFYEESLATVSRAAARRRQPRDRRRPPSTPPTPSTPLSISPENLAVTLRPHPLSGQCMWTFGYPLPRTLPITTWDVNAPEFVPGSQCDSGRGSFGLTPLSNSDEEANAVEHLPAPSTPLSISTEKLAEALRPYLLSRQCMWTLGYPVEIEPMSSKAVVYINPPPRNRPWPNTTWDMDAPEFVPGSQCDSGRGSLGSTPRSDSDEEVDAVEHLCVRCDKTFRMTREGEFLKVEPCLYHWGRVSADCRFACCKSLWGSKGCSTARYHVWSGTRPGMNGPLEGYVRARSPRGGVYAIDTEMCYTTAGLELASIAVIAADGRLVYQSLVKPSSPVVDHNTRFSGIRPRDLARATKTLKDVQNDILGFVGIDTILIGHALDNDLRALKLLHGSVVDTCALYPHARGFPMRRSLRALSEEFLGRIVQHGSVGHSPLEDARAAMDLVLLKIHKELASRALMSNHLPMFHPYNPLINAA
ncbi:unnamed protein product [Arctia plantaginis]|uniref:Exonuclease domain-containing protein n=1 Tax=Arctia plantaginis TaxID=874455 RepID=A0A8S0YU17_ARCPL|nr:unnamed protein product [Arctia plantaginis]